MSGVLVSVEETNNLTTDTLLLGLGVVDQTLVGRDDEVSELSGWKDSVDELVQTGDSHGESWGDDSGLVDSAVQVNDDLASSGVVDDLEVVDVAFLLHLDQELDEDLGDGSQDNLKTAKLEQSDSQLKDSMDQGQELKSRQAQTKRAQGRHQRHAPFHSDRYPRLKIKASSCFSNFAGKLWLKTAASFCLKEKVR